MGQESDRPDGRGHGGNQPLALVQRQIDSSDFQRPPEPSLKMNTKEETLSPRD